MSNLIKIRPVILGVIHVKVRKDRTDNAISICVRCVVQRLRNFCEPVGQFRQLRECGSSITEM
jgi:hypothetical protein